MPKPFDDQDAKMWHEGSLRPKYNHQDSIECEKVKNKHEHPDIAIKFAAAMTPKTFYKPDEKIWLGEMMESTYNQQDSIGSVVLKMLLDNPEHISQIGYESGKQLTNGDVAKLSIQAAQHFQKLGLVQCDLIAMCVENSDNVAPLFFGAMLAGLCVYTINPSYNEEAITRICSMAQPKLMICDGSVYHKVRTALEKSDLSSIPLYAEHVHIEGVPSTLNIFQESNLEEVFKVPSLVMGADQVAAIVCTSGTTGYPKGVNISHAAVLNAFGVSNVSLGMTSSDVKTFPMRGIYGIHALVVLVQSVMRGMTCILSAKPINADSFIDIVDRYKPNFLTCFPPVMATVLNSDRLADIDFSCIRVCVIGGCKVLYSLVEQYKQLAPNAIFSTLYSSSETCCVVSSGLCESTNSIGKLMPNIEVKIIDNQGNRLGPNDTGEICIRTKFPWAGYFKNPEATKLAYDEDGFYHSDDLGYFNEDGLLYIVERKSDIRRYGVCYFAPSDIEKVIQELPAVLNVCAVGIPDSIYGHVAAAAVVKRAGCNIEKSEIIEHVAKRMQYYEQLHGGVYFFEDLPLTLSGKVDRRQVTKLCITIIDGVSTSQ